MRILITGTSKGIGRATAIKFLNEGHEVTGFDILPSSINHHNYHHYIIDVSDSILPEINNINIIINNAGQQKNNETDIDINLKGVIRISEKYAFNDEIKAVVNVASTSGTTGAEFPHYAASKGGVIAYSKNLAIRLAKYGATCNSISPGGVITDINDHILKDKDLYEKVLDEALLHKWAKAEEIAEWIYFVAVINKSMTGEDLVIDNGEKANFNFIW